MYVYLLFHLIHTSVVEAEIVSDLLGTDIWELFSQLNSVVFLFYFILINLFFEKLVIPWQNITRNLMGGLVF